MRSCLFQAHVFELLFLINRYDSPLVLFHHYKFMGKNSRKIQKHFWMNVVWMISGLYYIRCMWYCMNTRIFNVHQDFSIINIVTKWHPLVINWSTPNTHDAKKEGYWPLKHAYVPASLINNYVHCIYRSPVLTLAACIIMKNVGHVTH